MSNVTWNRPAAVSSVPIAQTESRRAVLAQFVVVAAILLLPLAYVLVPPLQDYPNHLARMAVIVRAGEGVIDPFYAINWSLVPNLIMDLIVPPLVPWLGIYAAGRVFVGLTFLVMLAGPLLVHRALYGRWSAWPLVGGLFIYNGFLFTGLMNYLFGAGLAVWGLAAWIGLRNRNPFLRMVVSTAFAFGLFVCHLYAVGIYGIGILGFEIWKLARPRLLRTPLVLLRDLAVLIVPFLPLLPLLLRSVTWGLALQYDWEAQGKLWGVQEVFSVYSDVADILVIVLMIAAIALGLKRRVLFIHPAGLVVLAVGLVVFLIMPRQLFGSWLADQRLPIAVMFLVIGFARLDVPVAAWRSFKFSIVIALIAVRVVDVSANWIVMSQSYADVQKAVQALPEGARILVVNSDRPGNWPGLNEALFHSASLATIERKALVSRNFVVAGKQIMETRAPWSEHIDDQDGDPPYMSQVIASIDGPAPSGPAYWDRWPETFTHIYLLGAEEGGPNPLPSRLTLLRESDGFQLYAIKAGPPTAP
jgi:hypothetical protein